MFLSDVYKIRSLSHHQIGVFHRKLFVEVLPILQGFQVFRLAVYGIEQFLLALLGKGIKYLYGRAGEKVLAAVDAIGFLYRLRLIGGQHHNRHIKQQRRHQHNRKKRY